MGVSASHPQSRASHRRGGIGFVVLALLCFGALDTTTKFASATAPLVTALWLRYLVQAGLTTAVLWPSRGARLFRTARPGLHIVRGLLLVICSGIAFLALQVMQVGEFTAIVMLTPLLLTVVAAVMLHERVSGLRWLCVMGGFSGAMHLYTGLVGLVVTTAALPLAWRAVPWPVWAAIGLMGVLATLGHFLFILAYSRTPVAELTPYLYLQIVFAALGGLLVFSHVPDTWSLAGIGLVITSGVFGTWLTRRETLLRSRLDSPEARAAAMAGADPP